MPFLLFTSIKPPSGDKLSYLRDCLSSWRASGFVPVAVNGPKETETLRQLDLGLDFAPLPADGKPRIGAILATIRNSGARFAGIINDDCKLIEHSDIANRLENGLERRIALAWRIDDENGKFSATPYGFDAFFFDTRYLPTDDFGFSIGDTWWDIWLPLACQAQGATVETFKTPLLTHKVHPFNWSWDQYDDNGRRLWASFGKPGIPSHAEVEKWQHSLAVELHARPQTISISSPEFEATMRCIGSAMVAATRAKDESWKELVHLRAELTTVRMELEAMRNPAFSRITAPLQKAVMAARTIAAKLI